MDRISVYGLQRRGRIAGMIHGRHFGDPAFHHRRD